MTPQEPLSPTLGDPLGLRPSNAPAGVLAPVSVPRAMAAGSVVYTAAQVIVTVLSAVALSPELLKLLLHHPAEWAGVAAAVGYLIQAYLRDGRAKGSV